MKTVTLPALEIQPRTTSYIADGLRRLLNDLNNQKRNESYSYFTLQSESPCDQFLKLPMTIALKNECLYFAETDTEYQDAHAEINQITHVCTISETVVEQNHVKPGKVGRFKARIAPGNQKNCSSQKSKDSIKDKGVPVQGNVQPHGHHHSKNVNHHQCCGAFGNPHVRHKSSNASCHLI